MDVIDRTISTVRRRLLAHDLLGRLGWAAVVALTVSGLARLIDRLLAVRVPWWVYLIISVAATVGGVVWAWVRQPGREAIAAMIDQRLGLRDRLGSALFAMSRTDDAFARAVVDDARRSVRELDARRAFPVRPTRVWGWAAPLAAVVVVLAVFMPAMDVVGLAKSRQEQNEREARADMDRRQLEQAIRTVKLTQAPDRQAADSPEAKSPAIEELEQLAQRDLADPAVRREAADRLAELDRQLADKIEQDKRDFQSLQSQMSQLEQEKPGPADDLSDALRRSDFEAAKREVDELSKKWDTMSDNDRRAATEQLDALAEQLRQAAQQFAQAGDEERKQLEKSFRDAGLNDEQIRQLLDEPPAPPKDTTPPEQSPTDSPDKTTPNPSTQDTQRSDAPRSADDTTKAPATDTPQQKPDPTTKPAQPDQPGDKTKEPQQPKDTQQPNDAQQPRDDKQPPPEQRDDGQPKQSPDQRSDTQQQMRDGQTQSQEQRQSPTQKQQQPTASQQQQQQSQQRDGDNKQQAIERELRKQGQTQQQSRENAERLAREMQQRTQRQQGSKECKECTEGLSKSLKQFGQSDKPGSSNSQQQNQSTEQRQQAADDTKQTLDELERMRKDIEGQQQSQQAVREAMRRLSQPDPASPSQQPSLARRDDQTPQRDPSLQSSQAGRGDGGNPIGDAGKPWDYKTQPRKDARDGQGRIISRWLTQGPNDKGESTAEYQRAVTTARGEAEKAVSDQRVPSRYHEAIQRYFEQLPATPAEAEGE